MLIIWEIFSRIVVWITKTMFKAILIAFLIIGIIRYTPVGEGFQAMADKYSEITGNNVQIQVILDDLETQVQESMENFNGIQGLFNRKTSE